LSSLRHSQTFDLAWVLGRQGEPMKRYEGDRIELMEKALTAAGALTGALAVGQTITPQMGAEINSQIIDALESPDA
jgi:hypothetical protein